MIGRLIEWCIRNRVMVLLLTISVIAGSVWSMLHLKIDAIPDLSDVQVIVRTEYPGQAPQIVEDQVTYPLTTAMLAVPHAQVVRGQSWFGTSLVYIIFDDGTDLYWARSRVLEQINTVTGRLPEGVVPQLGPDATGVGWVYQYVLTTGRYCPRHPNGYWFDAVAGTWYADPAEAPVPARLERRRVVEDDQQVCPLDGTPLKSSDLDLSDLRSIQDWQLRYALTAVDGVSEVAAIGGFVKQYQVVVDPVKLLAYDIALGDVEMAIRRSNSEIGGSVVEMAEAEYMVRGEGYLGTLDEAEVRTGLAEGRRLEELRTDKALEQLRKIALGATGSGSPIYLADIAEVRVGPEMRRGVAEWNGQGETVGGIVVMRQGANARAVIQAVQAKLSELEKGLPPGVAVQTAYDRSDLIERAVGTLRHTLIEEIIVVALVCILFLLHARSELVAVFVVPTGVLIAMALMYLLDINANIMSLGGIAIAIGVMVDSSIIMVENAHKHLDREEERLAELTKSGGEAIPRPRTQIILEAAKEVGPSLFFSLLIITVSFLPVFALGEESGRLFRPLAYTKTFAMAAAALLAVTIIPVMMTVLITDRILPRRWGWKKNLLITLAIMLIPAVVLMLVPLPRLHEYRYVAVIAWLILSGMLLVPQRIIHEQANPISRFLQWAYEPFFALAMRFKWVTLALALGLIVATWWPLQRLGNEFMPPMEEGDLLYMPTTDPGISMTKARELLQQTDLLIRQFPEVRSVMGKIGAAESATDPAPPSMFETTLTLHRDKTRWRHVPVDRFFADWPQFLRQPLGALMPLTRPITTDELINGYNIRVGDEAVRVRGLNEALQIPGLTNSRTMPIRTRIDMLATGIKTPVGIKVLGEDLGTLSTLGEQIANALRTDPRTAPHTLSAFAEKSLGGNYVDIQIDRDEIARYGLKVADVQDVIATALGGMTIGWTIEGLERYPISLRYPHELRDNLPLLRQMLVPTPTGGHIPLGQLATFQLRKGPDMIKSENARRTAWIYIDITGIDVGTYVERAQQVVEGAVTRPSGYSIEWSGQYEYILAARQRLMVVVPLTGVIIVLLLYMATRSWLRVAIVLLAVPFSLIGAFWFLWLLDYELSLAVWVGIIALAGLDAETGLVMLLYLDNSYERSAAQGRMKTADDLWDAIHDGAVQRIRPKTMTVVTTFIGLVPLMWATGAGADTMRRLAAPMIGGLTTSFIGELLVYPVIFYMAKRVGMSWPKVFSSPTVDQDMVPRPAS